MRDHPAQTPCPSKKIPNETLYEGPINKVLPSYFDEIDESMVLKAITLTKGAGGPSHMDAELYRHLLTSKKFKKENKELRNQIAKLTRLLATKCIDPHSLESYVACRLLPLDKNLGVQPIGVGEILRGNHREMCWLGAKRWHTGLCWPTPGSYRFAIRSRGGNTFDERNFLARRYRCNYSTILCIIY